MAAIKTSTDFAAIPNEILRNKNLSFGARGLFCELYSLFDTETFSVEGIDFGHRKKEVASGFEELEAAGLIIGNESLKQINL